MTTRTTAADTAHVLVERAAALCRQERAIESRARAVAERLARRLVTDHGATAVVLFGSLARGDFTVRSDIDLAVGGLSEAAALWQIGYELEADATPFSLDLVALERLPDSVRARVAATGVRLA